MRPKRQRLIWGIIHIEFTELVLRQKGSMTVRVMIIPILEIIFFMEQTAVGTG